MSKAALAVVGLAVVGGGLFAASKAGAFGGGDDAGPTPPDSTNGPVFTVTASSGAVYEVHFVKEFDTESGKQTFWDVFDIQGRVLRYSQLGDDQSTRVFIMTPRSLGDESGRGRDPSINIVMNDFGIAFEGGQVMNDDAAIILTGGMTVPPGQIMVSAGHWMATVDVPFPASLVVSASLIKAGLEEQGWTNVAVYTDVPKFWPISKNGNYFVEGDWTKDARLFAVPPAVVEIKSNAVA